MDYKEFRQSLHKNIEIAAENVQNTIKFEHELIPDSKQKKWMLKHLRYKYQQYFINILRFTENDNELLLNEKNSPLLDIWHIFKCVLPLCMLNRRVQEFLLASDSFIMMLTEMFYCTINKLDFLSIKYQFKHHQNCVQDVHMSDDSISSLITSLRLLDSHYKQSMVVRYLENETDLKRVIARMFQTFVYAYDYFNGSLFRLMTNKMEKAKQKKFEQYLMAAHRILEICSLPTLVFEDYHFGYWLRFVKGLFTLYE